MNCWSHRPRSSRTSHSIDKPLFIRWWPGLFVFTIWSATELKKNIWGRAHIWTPPISIPWLRPWIHLLAFMVWNRNMSSIARKPPGICIIKRMNMKHERGINSVCHAVWSTSLCLSALVCISQINWDQPKDSIVHSVVVPNCGEELQIKFFFRFKN